MLWEPLVGVCLIEPLARVHKDIRTKIFIVGLVE